MTTIKLLRADCSVNGFWIDEQGGVGESFKHGYEEEYMIENYRFYEIVKYTSADGPSIVRSFYREELPESRYEMDDFCAQQDNCKCYYCVYGRWTIGLEGKIWDMFNDRSA